MAVTYVANTALQNVISGNWVASGLPAGTIAGDIVVAAIACRNTETMVANTANGWVQIHSSFTGNNSTTANSGKGSFYSAYYVYQGVTPDLNFYRTAGDAGLGALVSLRGVDYTAPKGNVSLTVAANSLTPNTVTLTAGPSAFLLSVLAGGSDGSASAPNCATEPLAAGWTVRVNGLTTSGSDTTLGVGSATKNTAGGATGTQNWVMSTSGFHVVALTEFKAAVAPSAAPTSVNANTISGETIQVNWVAPSGDGGSPVSGYKIERETPVGGGFSTLVANTTTNAVRYYDSTCAPLTQYNYKITAINIVGLGPTSTASANTTLVGPAITYVANGALTNVTSGNWVGTMPAGVVNGDLLVAAIACRNTQPMVANTSNGWVQVYSSFTGNNNTTPASGTGSLLVSYYPYIGVTPDLNFYRTAGDAGLGTIFALRGADLDDPIGNASLTVASVATATPNTTAITTQANNSMITVILAGGCDDTYAGANSEVDIAGGEYTSYYANSTSGADTTLAVSYATKTVAGLTGTFVAKPATASFHVVAAIEFRAKYAKPLTPPLMVGPPYF